MVTLVFQVMDVTEDGLEDQEDDYDDPEDWVEFADLGGRRQSVSLRCGYSEEGRTYISSALVCDVHT